MRTPPRRLRRWKATAAIAATTTAVMGGTAGAALGAPTDAPGAPGAAATWTTGDKEGLGTSTTAESKLWYTLTGGTMSEVYYPSGTTPNTRELQFAVTDGWTSTQLESDATVTRAVSLVDPQSLTYRQTSTDAARPLAADQDVHHRPGSADGPARRPVRGAHTRAVPAVRAVRPVPGRRRGQRLGKHVRLGAALLRQPQLGRSGRLRPRLVGTVLRHVDRVRRHLRRARRPRRQPHPVDDVCVGRTRQHRAGRSDPGDRGQHHVHPRAGLRLRHHGRPEDRQRQPRAAVRHPAGRLPGRVAPLHEVPQPLLPRSSTPGSPRSTGPRS